MSVYVEMINLDRAKDRRSHMRALLAERRIDAHMHPAVDGSLISKEEIYSQVELEGNWGYVSPAAAACSISHANVWERFLETDNSHCLVLEDDIHLAEDASHWISDLDWWPQDADIVKLERWRGRSLKILLDRKAQTHLGRRVARLYTRHVGAAGYMITRKAARKLLERRPLPMVVDNLIFNINASPAARQLRIYQVQPALVVQGNEPPGWVPPPFVKHRPEGAMLVRQKVKRGYFELAYPLSTWIKMIFGRARFEAIAYANTTCTANRPTADLNFGADPAP